MFNNVCCGLHLHKRSETVQTKLKSRQRFMGCDL